MKYMKTRISQLHNTEADWLKVNSWVPDAGEIIVYDPDDVYNYTRLKIGDGDRQLKDLAFIIDSAALALIQKQHYFEKIDAGRITDYN
jgi:hypothetical protein